MAPPTSTANNDFIGDVGLFVRMSPAAERSRLSPTTSAMARYFTRSMKLTFSPAVSASPTPEGGSWLLLSTALVAAWQSRRSGRGRRWRLVPFGRSRSVGRRQQDRCARHVHHHDRQRDLEGERRHAL